MEAFIIREGPYSGWPTYEYALKKFEKPIAESRTVKELLESASKLWPSDTYLVYAPTGETYTYGELNKEANKLAHTLSELGIKKGDRVALFLFNTPDYIKAIHACSKIGAIEVPVNFFYREQEAYYIMSNSGSKAVIVDPKLAPIVDNIRGRLSELKHVIIAGDEPIISNSYTLTEIVKGASESNPKVEIKEEDLIALIYTSGTTGLPKGTMLTHKSYVLSAKAIGCFLPKDEKPKEQANYTGLPLFHINAQIYSSLGMMCLGGRLILTNKFSPSKFWQEIKEYGATSFNLLGAMINILYSMPSSPLDKEHGARYLIIGGTPKPLWEKFEERFNVKIQEGYSQTEDPLPFLNPPEDYRKIGSFGVPVFPDIGHEVMVVDDKGNPLPPGTPGELIRRSPAQMVGYWKDPKRTAEAIKDGWLYSGDIVIRDSEGYTFFVERKKFIIRRAGENIAAWEVEAVIKTNPKVQDVAVIPVPDPYRGEEVKAFIRPKPGVSLTPEEIVEWTAKRLAYFKVPRFIEIVETLPYTPTGRVQKWKLKEDEEKREYHGWDRDKEMPDWRKRFYKT